LAQRLAQGFGRLNILERLKSFKTFSKLNESGIPNTISGYRRPKLPIAKAQVSV